MNVTDGCHFSTTIFIRVANIPWTFFLIELAKQDSFPSYRPSQLISRLLNMAFSMIPSPTDVQILTTMRYEYELERCRENNAFVVPERENKYYMLTHHRDRMLAAAEALRWPLAVEALSGDSGLTLLEDNMKIIGYRYFRSAKVRLVLSRTGVLTVNSSNCDTALEDQAAYPAKFSLSPPLSTQTWRIQLCPVSFPVSIYTQHKTTFRSHYDFARSHLTGDSSGVEVLLMNLAGEIMEGSLATPYFYRNGKWVTPAKECGGNQGTTRRWALEKGLCVEAVVRGDELRNLEIIWLSNGVRGFGWGFMEVEAKASEVKTEPER